jgi:hypothetical protein
MKEALSRLYVYIILFLRLCVRWYNRSSLGRLWSSLKSPFELDYQDLVQQIKASSVSVEDLANAGARIEIRDIRIIQGLHHSQSMGVLTNIIERQTSLESSVTQLMQVATLSKTLTERISSDVQDINKTNYRLEFHHLVQFLAPRTSPEAALSKVQSYSRRNPTTSQFVFESIHVKNTLRNWVFTSRSSLLVVRMGLLAQTQAREMAVEVIQGLSTSSQCVFWNLTLPYSLDQDDTMASVFKSIIHQVLKHLAGSSAQFAEQLNLVKVNGHHTESEWVDLICLLLSKLPKIFLVIETEGIRKAHQDDPEWADRFLQHLQKVVDRTSAAGNCIKILLLVYGKTLNVTSNSSVTSDLLVTSLPTPAPLPPHLRHMVRRTGLNSKGWRMQMPKI